jgi:uncharacterized membrane protein YedE/YeeE
MTTQRPHVLIAIVIMIALELHFLSSGAKLKFLFPVGIGMGLALYHAAFGFTAAYRRAFVQKDISGVTAQLIMLAVAMVLFAPILSKGEVLGHGVSGAVAPVGLSMAFGALLFGIGMQLASGCGSGTLFTAGGGNARMVVVLIFFCIGGFWGSLDLHLWQQLPDAGSISLGQELGWFTAISIQLILLAIIYGGFKRYGGTNLRPLWFNNSFTLKILLVGPWPLLLSALLLALFNWLTLLIAGHPWSITWAFALWGAKTATLMGWDPLSSTFWTSGFQENALHQSVFSDVTSVMNFGIMLGALLAAALAGKISPRLNMGWKPFIAAVIGGLLLGYGARLGYGCNIGAFFSGVASTSLHGWVWILAALLGNWIGIRLRPTFSLSNT